MSDRLNLIVDDGIGALMSELAGGERKRGEWLTKLVRAMHEQEQTAQASDLEQLRYAFAGLLGQIKILEGRLLKVEHNLAAVIVNDSAQDSKK